MNPSIASMRRNLEQYEVEKMQRDQQAQQAQQKQQEQTMQQQQQMAKEAQQFELDKMDREYYYKMEIEKMKGMLDVEKQAKDLDNDGIPDVVEVEKIRSQERLKLMELSNKRELEEDKIDIDQAKLKLEEKKINMDKILKEKEIRSKEKVERIKAKARPKATSK